MASNDQDDFNEPEQKELLIEILRVTQTASSLARILAQNQPSISLSTWDNIRPPSGRSLGQCKRAYNQLTSNPRFQPAQPPVAAFVSSAPAEPRTQSSTFPAQSKLPHLLPRPPAISGQIPPPTATVQPSATSPQAAKKRGRPKKIVSEQERERVTQPSPSLESETQPLRKRARLERPSVSTRGGATQTPISEVPGSGTPAAGSPALYGGAGQEQSRPLSASSWRPASATYGQPSTPGLGPQPPYNPPGYYAPPPPSSQYAVPQERTRPPTLTPSGTPRSPPPSSFRPPGVQRQSSGRSYGHYPSPHLASVTLPPMNTMPMEQPPLLPPSLGPQQHQSPPPPPPPPHQMQPQQQQQHPPRPQPLPPSQYGDVPRPPSSRGEPRNGGGTRRPASSDDKMQE